MFVVHIVSIAFSIAMVYYSVAFRITILYIPSAAAKGSARQPALTPMDVGFVKVSNVEYQG